MKVLRVAGSTRCAGAAGSMVKCILKGLDVCFTSIGAGATNQAAKSAALVQKMLSAEKSFKGDVTFSISFRDETIGQRKLAAVQFTAIVLQPDEEG